MSKVYFVACLAMFIAFCSCSEKTAEQKKDTSPITNTVSPTHKIDGEYIEKYASGIIKIKGTYSSGKKIGTWVSFYENGVLWSQNNYRLDTLEGPTLNQYESGKVHYKGQYQKGEKVGKWTFYDEKGELLKEVDY